MVRLGQTLNVGPAAFAGLMLFSMLGLTACTIKTTTPEDLTARVIQSIDAGDFQQTARAFESSVRTTMTPDSFKSVSRLIRSFGTFQVANQISALPNQRYDLEATFDGGSMLVQLRLNQAGEIAALHLIPNVLVKTP